MRNLGLILAGFLAALALVWLGYIVFVPEAVTAQNPVVIDLTDDLSTVNRELETTEANYRVRLENLHAAIQIEEDTLQAQNSQWQTEIDRLNAELAARQEELNQLQALQQTLNLSQTLRLEDEIARLQAQQQAYRQQLEDLEDQITALESQLKESQSR
jgi:septal ring factor EnvC (AmiA/AmiB activator)